MRTLIPSSDDELNEEFFAAWFYVWSTLQDDVDPSDAYAAYCALWAPMFTWGAVIFVGLWLVLRDVNAIVKAKLMGNPLLIHTIVIGSGLLIHGGSADGAMAAIVSGVCSALYVRGGLQAVLGKFQQAGYGQQAQSWIGTGQNMPIDAGALSQIFGQGQLGQIASQLGMSHDEAAGQLAQTLPDAVDRMTPEGAVPEGHNDLVNQVLSMLQQGRRPG